MEVKAETVAKGYVQKVKYSSLASQLPLQILQNKAD